jgi:hypothetical protein
MIVVSVGVVIVGLNVNAAQRADWAARSGGVEVELTGEMQTDEVEVRFAWLETDAEYETTTLRLHVDRKLGSWSRNPPVVVAFTDMTCQKTSSRLWASAVRNVMTLHCDAYVSRDALGGVGVGTVDFPG